LKTATETILGRIHSKTSASWSLACADTANLQPRSLMAATDSYSVHYKLKYKVIAAIYMFFITSAAKVQFNS